MELITCLRCHYANELLFITIFARELIIFGIYHLFSTFAGLLTSLGDMLIVTTKLS